MAIIRLSNKGIKKGSVLEGETRYVTQNNPSAAPRLTTTLLLHANTPHSLFILHNTELGKPVPNSQEQVQRKFKILPLTIQGFQNSI